MTLADSMKLFLCAVKNDGTTPDDIMASTATDLWVLMADAFAERFNGGAGVLAPLSLEFGEGATSGTTRPYVTGAATGESFVYLLGVTGLPTSGSDLSTWTTWDGTSDILTTDGQNICIAQIDANGIVTRAGIGTAVVAI